MLKRLKEKMDKEYDIMYGTTDEDALIKYHIARTAYYKELYANRIEDTWGGER